MIIKSLSTHWSLCFSLKPPTPHPPPLLPLFPRAGMTLETLVSRTLVTAQSYCKHKRSDTFLLAQTHTHVINVPERHDVETQEAVKNLLM